MSHNLPLHEMITSVVRNAQDRLSQGHVKTAMEEDICEKCGASASKCGCAVSKEAGADTLTDPTYVEKLASACDFIAVNFDGIEPANRGVLGGAIAKLAGESVPPPNPKGALETTSPSDGEQKYKKDKPAAGHDSAASEAGNKLRAPRPTDSATQVDNNMHSAPGGNSGSVPKSTYPEKGPLAKSAGLADILQRAGRAGSRGGELLRGGKKMTYAREGAKGLEDLSINTARPGNVPDLALRGTDVGREARKSLAARGALGVGAGVGAKSLAGKEKSAAELAKEQILSKLAGEDVMKATVSSAKGGGPSPGDGVMDALEAEQVPKNPTDGSGYGNQQRSMIQSNQAAIGYDKADAKKPRAKELKEVLTHPAFSPKHDSKLREQLQNSGQAGVKIAGASTQAILQKAAAEGRFNPEAIRQYQAKVAEQTELSEGEPKEPPKEEGADTKDPPPSEDSKVQKLKALMNSKKKKKEKESMGGMSGMGGMPSGAM